NQRISNLDQRIRTGRIQVQGSETTQSEIGFLLRATIASIALVGIFEMGVIAQPPAQAPAGLPQIPAPGAELQEVAPPKTASGRSLDELEQLLRASRAELGARLKNENSQQGDPEATPSVTGQDPLRDGEKRFLELESIIKERRVQRELELLSLPPLEELPLKGTRQRLEGNPDSKENRPPNASATGNSAVREAPRPSLPTPSEDAMAMGEALLLSDVIASTYRSFPKIEIARLQAGVARGETTTALGAYDVRLDYYSINQVLGNFENYRNGVVLSRQLWWGGYALAGYRIGRGNFEPWYQERPTDKAGEFRVGWIQPLLQGRAIDPHRVELFQANLDRQAVGPEIQQNVLEASLDASYVYWKWVEAGNVLRAQEQLLRLAERRNQGLQTLFERGLSTRQELAINAQTISERQLKVYESRLKFRDAAFKMAIFLRDETGDPMLAAPDWLPSDFPRIPEVPDVAFDIDFLAAQERRPELALIQIDLQKLRWDLELARNQMLPTVDFNIQAAQDIGAPASKANDKGELMLESGLSGGVPIQRRKARGKIDATLAKLQQTEQKRRLQLNKIEVELRTARNNLGIAREMVVRSEQLMRETMQTLDYFRRDYAAGNRDFLFLLQQEVKATEAEIKLLDAEREFFMSLSTLQATLGLDPLEQSLGIDLPPGASDPVPPPDIEPLPAPLGIISPLPSPPRAGGE
ncbi:MAG: TolC family protein, partial [Planctomycetota bacterium]